MRRVRGRHQFEFPRSPSLENGLLDDIQMLRDSLDAQLEQQLDAFVHRSEVLKWKSAQLVPTGIAPETRGIVRQAPAVVGALERHPPNDRRFDDGDELLSHVDEPGAPRRQEPLLTTARDDVDRRRLHIQRDLADTLDGIHHQKTVGRAARPAQSVEVHPVSVGELDE